MLPFNHEALTCNVSRGATGISANGLALETALRHPCCPVCPETSGHNLFFFISLDVLQKRVMLSYIPSQIAFNNQFFLRMVSN